MKKYILILTSLGVLIVFGLSGFIKVVKSDPVISKKTSYTANAARQLGLYTSSFSESVSAQQTAKLDKASCEQLLKNIAQLPLMFQKNMGQWQKEILYRATAQDTKVGFRKNGITFLSFREIEEDDEDGDHDEENNEEDEEEEEMYETMVWNMNFKGMNSSTQIVAEGEVAGVTNYLLGNDSTKWVRNTPESRLINYKGIYDNIDLHYYGLENYKLEYDYIVKPGGNIANIKMALEGAGKLTINSQGELIITTPWGKVAEARPYSYQVIDGVKKEVDIRYNILDGSTFGFKAYEDYNANYDLIIDPKTLLWSTFAKGNDATHYVQDIGIDANKNSYVAGWTVDNWTVTAGVIQSTFSGNEDAFVTKFNRWGTAVIYSTYAGGSDRERTYSLVVSGAGNAYIAGRTDSGNYPTASAAYAANQGGTDTFISALNTLGTGFTYSTYFGGSSADKGGRGLFLDASNRLYVTGQGKGSSFPTTAGVIRTAAMADGTLDAYVARFGSAGTLQLCTLLGGSSDDEGNGIFVNSAGEVYVTGETKGNFPAGTNPGYDASANGGRDAFVAKLNATLSTLLYSTYLGGGTDDIGYGIFVNSADEVYVTGTATSGFPTTVGAFRTAFAGGATDIFVSKLNAAGNGLIYSTYLGGSGDESVMDVEAVRGSDIIVNSNGEAYVSGITASTDFPTSVATNGGYDVTFNTNDDGFISLLNATGTGLLCSTYLGGTANDYKKMSIALDMSGGTSGKDTIYGAITSHSPDFPIAQGQGTVYSPTKINLGDDQPVVLKMVSCSTPLPVSLVSFKGNNKGDYNLLEWTTATEANNDYFIIERSSDGVNFIAIGTVDGAGNSVSTLNYSYSDHKEGKEITYYRLKQTDIDGKTSYSKVIVINAPQTGKALDLAITSPVTDYLNYRVCCLEKGNAKVEITDMSGRVVINANVQVIEGYNTLSLNAKDLTEGSYILTLTSDNGTVSARFIK